MTEKEMQILEANYIKACNPHGEPNRAVLNASIMYLQGKEPPKLNKTDKAIFNRDVLPYCRVLLKQQK